MHHANVLAVCKSLEQSVEFFTGHAV